MKSSYFHSVAEFLQSSQSIDGIKLLLIAEKCHFHHSMIQSLHMQCYGAIFPEVIYKNKHYDDGLIVLELEQKPLCVENIDNEIDANINLLGISSMIVFVDGLSAHIDSFLFSIFESIDEDCILFGGGAGKLTLQQEKVIFTPDAIYKDAALIIPLTQKLQVGVHHGWEYLDGPFIATSTQDNLLKKINYADAYDIYKEIVQKDSGLNFNNNNFFDIAKSYPLGIVTMDGEVIVRDPILTQDGALLLVGVMPENSIINILKGKKENLIQAAKNAAEDAYEETTNAELIFMVDCISRALFLESSFTQEIEAVKERVGNVEVLGVLTLGEIANNSKAYINFYNKTCVVGAICSYNS